MFINNINALPAVTTCLWFTFQDQKYSFGRRESVKPSAYKKSHNFKVIIMSQLQNLNVHCYSNVYIKIMCY